MENLKIQKESDSPGIRGTTVSIPGHDSPRLPVGDGGRNGSVGQALSNSTGNPTGATPLYGAGSGEGSHGSTGSAPGGTGGQGDANLEGGERAGGGSGGGGETGGRDGAGSSAPTRPGGIPTRPTSVGGATDCGPHTPRLGTAGTVATRGAGIASDTGPGGGNGWRRFGLDSNDATGGSTHAGGTGGRGRGDSCDTARRGGRPTGLTRGRDSARRTGTPRLTTAPVATSGTPGTAGDSEQTGGDTETGGGETPSGGGSGTRTAAARGAATGPADWVLGAYAPDGRIQLNPS